MSNKTTTRTTAKATAANQLPVSLQESKTHLYLVNEDQDARVSLALSAAVDYCESVTGRVLRVSHTIVESYDGWPCSPVGFDYQPVYEISSVKYYDADNAQQTVSSSNYRLVQGNTGAVLEFDQDYTFPTTYDRSDAVQVTYLAGYSDVATVPAAAKQAVLLKLQQDWGDVENTVQANALERSIKQLLASVDTGAYR